MNKSIKHKVIFLTFLMFFSSQSMAGERILPLPKPTVEQEIKKIVAKKKEIYPQKKPTKINNETVEEETKQTDLDTAQDQDKEKSLFIYPQKKPIIIKKVVSKVVPKSSILSKKDFEIAKNAFEAIDKKKWQT